MTSVESQLRVRLVDEHSQTLLTGALEVAQNTTIPIRHSFFSSALRELFTHTLHLLAQDDEVRKCAWFVQEPGTNRPTRRQRMKYATQGGIPNTYIEKLGIDLDDLHGEAVQAMDEMSKYTHLRPGNVVQDQAVIDAFAQDAMSALLNLFSSFDECRAAVIDGLIEKIDDEAIEASVSETLADVDILATHHFIQAVYINDVKVTALTSNAIRFYVEGSLSIQLQYGSGSDMSRGDGALIDVSFPFFASMRAPADNVEALTTEDYSVDTRSWYGSDDE